MCELFGLSSASRIEVNKWLKEFFRHSEKHCHGWGMAMFYGDAVSLEKEPCEAYLSHYLRSRMLRPIVVDNMIAHIRLASVGSLGYENNHPFVKHDNSHCCWTLAHNGTMFDSPRLDAYRGSQEGETDSERILFYLVDQINRYQNKTGSRLNDEQRFLLLEKYITELTIGSDVGSRGNKLNLLLYDGRYMYVHSNYADTLFIKHYGDSLLIATTPLDSDGDWSALSLCRLMVYEKGRCVFEGTHRSKQYFDRVKDEEYQYLNYNLM